MTDQGTSDSRLFPIVIALAAALLLSIVINLLLYRRPDIWKQRWHEDTKQFSLEIKEAAQKISDISQEKLQLERELAAMKAAAGK